MTPVLFTILYITLSVLVCVLFRLRGLVKGRWIFFLFFAVLFVSPVPPLVLMLLLGPPSKPQMKVPK